LLVFEDERADRPIVVALLQSAPAKSAAKPIEAMVDGKRARARTSSPAATPALIANTSQWGVLRGIARTHWHQFPVHFRVVPVGLLLAQVLVDS
jgi:hypothetical protein